MGGLNEHAEVYMLIGTVDAFPISCICKIELAIS